MQISFEYIWPAQPKHAGFIQRQFAIHFRFPDFGGDARRQSANGSRTARWLHVFAGPFRFRIWQIDADHRRSLSEPVAFEDFLLKAFFKMAGQIERQLFGAGDNEAQTSELLRLGLTQIQPQERGRQKQKGKLMAFDQRRAVCRVEWIRICHDAHTFNKRIPKCDR